MPTINPTLIPPTGNPLGNGPGKMAISLENGSGQPNLNYGQPDQSLVLTFTRTGQLTFSPGSNGSGGDYIVVRFRPGSLERSDRVKLLSPSSLQSTGSTAATGLLEYRIEAVAGGTFTPVTPLSISLGGVLPSPYLVGHLLRLEVEWQLTDNGPAPAAGAAPVPTTSTGSRTLFLAIQMGESGDLDGALGRFRQMLHPDLETWIEGDGVIVPTLSQHTPIPNELTLCLRNPKRLNRTLTNVNLSVDLGTDPDTSLDPQAGITGTWSKLDKNGSPSSVQGTDVLARSLADSWNPGETVKVELGNLMTQAGVHLGKRRIGVHYAAQLAVPQGAQLWERRGNNGQLFFGSEGDDGADGFGVNLGQGCTIQMTVITPATGSSGGFFELLRLAGADSEGNPTCMVLALTPGDHGYGFSLSSGSLTSTNPSAWIDPLELGTPDQQTSDPMGWGINVPAPSLPFGTTTTLIIIVTATYLSVYVGDAQPFTDNNYLYWRTKSVQTILSIGAGSMGVQFSDVRIWNQLPQVDELSSVEQRTVSAPPATALMAHFPLDDLDNIPRNKAAAAQVFPVSLKGAWSDPVKNAGKPIEGLLPLEVTISNFKQLQTTAANPPTTTTTTTLYGNTGLSVNGAITGVAGTINLGTLPIQAVASQNGGNMLQVGDAADKTGLSVYGPITGVTGVDGDALRTQNVVNLFNRKYLGNGRYLSCMIQLDSKWTAEANFQWPLNGSGYSNMNDTTYTLFEGTSIHHLVIRGGGRYSAFPWMYGPYTTEGFIPVGSIEEHFMPGSHHIAVVCDGTNWDYYLDHVKVGTIGPGTDLPATEPISAIGDSKDGGQSFGPIWGIRVWNVAHVPGTSVTDGVSPLLDIREDEPLPAGVTYASNTHSVPAEPPAPVPLPVRQDPGRLLPDGTIIMWKGLVAAIPVGWHLCDGRTVKQSAKPDVILPDFTDKMISDANDTGNYKLAYLAFYPGYHV